MARNFNGTNYLQTDSPDLSNGFTINCWVKLGNDSANGAAVTLHTATGAINYYLLFNNPGGNRVRFGKRSRTQGFVGADTSVGGTVGVWEMWTGWQAANLTDYGVSLNATDEDNQSVFRDPENVARMSIGIQGDDSLDFGLIGDVGEVSVYAGVLTLADRVALYNNGTATDPREIRPDLLLWYDPLYWDAPYINRAGNQNDLAEFAGAAPSAQHVPTRLVFPVSWQPPISGPPTVSLSGTATSAIETAGDFTVTQPGVNLSGTATSVLETSGDTELRPQLAGTATSVVDTSGDMTVNPPAGLFGTATSVVESAGDVTVTPPAGLFGTATSVVETSGTILPNIPIAGVGTSVVETRGAFPVGEFSANPCRVVDLPDEGRTITSTEC